MNGEFIEALEQLQKEKDIPFSSLIATVEAAMSSAYRKHFGVAEEVRVEVNREAHTVRMFARKPIYAETPEEGEGAEGSVAEGVAVAVATPPLVEGELTDEALEGAPIPIEYEEHEINLADFGRIAAQTAKQVVMQRIREAEREIVFDEFSHRVGEVVTAEVQRRDARSVYVAIGRVEALLPAHEQIPGEPYRFNDRVKVYILDVRKTTKNPQIIVSRTHPKLVERLFELEVPEVYDGIVELKSVAREPGARSKVAVFSRDPQIDAVGACVGHRGARVQAIVDELRGEKVDIVRFSDTMEEYLKSALSPAKVSRVVVAAGNKSATVIAPDTQLSLAIGRRGQNVRLAAQLTGCHIDIRSESQMAEQPEIAAAIAAAAAAVAEVAAAPAPERLRVYELARELGVESRDLVEILQEEGVEVTSHASSISGEQANMLREMLAGGAGTLDGLGAGE